MSDLNKKLAQVFKDMFAKTQLVDDELVTINDDPITVSVDLPVAVKSQLAARKILFTSMDDNADYQAHTVMLEKQLKSIFKAFNSLGKTKLQQQKIDEFLSHVRKNFNIETLREEKGEKFSIDDLKSLLARFNKYVQETVFVELAKLHTNNQKIKYNDTNYLAFLQQLRKAEIETRGKKPRRTYVNYNRDTGYFTAEIPLGLDSEGKPYTHQSYKRDSDQLSNYVLHVMGHKDETGAITILDQSTRAANYVPIDMQDDFAMLSGTLAQVKQRHDSVRSLNPTAKTYAQISLLSPLDRTLATIDVQQGYKQTLYTYLAFLMQNQAEENPMEMRYYVEGVNMTRSNSLSDPLKFQINTRFYNQLISDTLNKLSSSSNPIFSEMKNSLKSSEEKVKESWTTIIVPLIQYIRAIMENRVPLTNELDGLNSWITKLKNALAQHHQLEGQLFKQNLELWKEKQDAINKRLKELRQKSDQLVSEAEAEPELIAEYNLIQELNNFHFLWENDRYQSQDYNYQLQACVHRLSASLDHKIGINCNDSEDRTGLENVMVMGSYQYVRTRNHSLAPNLADKNVLTEIQNFAKKHQAKDAGINNTAANGVAGQQVDPKDMAKDLVNAEAVEMAKQTKKVYEPILKDDHWLHRLKKLKFGELIKMTGIFLIQKIFNKPFQNDEPELKQRKVSSESTSSEQKINQHPLSKISTTNDTNKSKRKGLQRGLSSFAAALLTLTMASAGNLSNEDSSFSPTSAQTQRIVDDSTSTNPYNDVSTTSSNGGPTDNKKKEGENLPKPTDNSSTTFNTTTADNPNSFNSSRVGDTTADKNKDDGTVPKRIEYAVDMQNKRTHLKKKSRTNPWETVTKVDREKLKEKYRQRYLDSDRIAASVTYPGLFKSSEYYFEQDDSVTNLRADIDYSTFRK